MIGVLLLSVILESLLADLGDLSADEEFLLFHEIPERASAFEDDEILKPLHSKPFLSANLS